MLFAPKEKGQGLAEFIMLIAGLGIIFYLVVKAIDPKAARRMKFW